MLQNKIDILTKQGKDENWLTQQRKAFDEGYDIDTDVADYFKRQDNLNRNINSNNALITKVNKKADEKIKAVYDRILGDGNLTINVGGVPVIFSAKEIADFSGNFDRYKKLETALGPSSKILYSYDDEKAKRDLPAKQHLLYEIFKKGEVRNTMSTDERNIADRGLKYKSEFDKAYDERGAVINEELKSSLTRNQGVTYTLSTTKPDEERELRGVMSAAIDLAETPNGIAESPGFDLDELKKIAKDKDVSITIKYVEGSEFQKPIYTITADGKSGRTKFNITPEQKISAFGNRYEPDARVSAIRPYEEQMRKVAPSGTSPWTTALDNGVTKLGNGHLNKTDFPSINIFRGINGNVTRNGDSWLLRLNLYDPIAKKWIDNIQYPSGYMREYEVIEFMNRLNDTDVYKILYPNSKTVTKEDLLKIKELLKTPL
jgi:hypothetical protein